MGIVYFIVALSLLVAIHEFGHFICAKLFNVYVYEFSLFMGPKLIQVKKGETKYTLRLLPIGGYCSMAGEQDLDGCRFRPLERFLSCLFYLVSYKCTKFSRCFSL